MPRTSDRTPAQRAGLWLGAALFAAILLIPAPEGYAPGAWRTAALAVLMAVWWATEAIPIPATAMLPLAAGPLLGVVPVQEAGHAYGSPTIFLILGGCLLALALERWSLHRRIAFHVVARAGSDARRLVFGIMVATAVVSMWVSNTSTTLMMLPVAASIAALVAPDPGSASVAQRNFSTAIVLSVAYAATIGGLATLIGTPTNALAAGFLEQTYGDRPSFAEWLVFGLPCSLLMLGAAWWVLVRISHPFHLPDIASARDVVREQLEAMGPPTVPERRVTTIVVAAAVAWVASPWLETLPGLGALSDMGIALAAGLALFLVPSGLPGGGMLLHGDDFRRVPWDTLFLFGGGLALAALIQGSGLSHAIGAELQGLSDWHPLAVTGVVILLMILWTEFTSNVATAATFMPILAALAEATGQPPVTLIIPAAVAASSAFMLPVGTAPNAIVYGSGRIEMRDMMRAGLWVNIVGWGVIMAVSAVTLRWLD
ncbi:MAG: SLC13/DASS family transporter [Lysobacterales bacterium]|nr:MAG: SLC13/DASS family transporter [Xanthomonadales bacterium]